MTLLSETQWDESKEPLLGFVRHGLAFPVHAEEDMEAQIQEALLLSECVEATIKHYGSNYPARNPSVTRTTQNGKQFDVVTFFIHRTHNYDNE